MKTLPLASYSVCVEQETAIRFHVPAPQVASGTFTFHLRYQRETDMQSAAMNVGSALTSRRKLSRHLTSLCVAGRQRGTAWPVARLLIA